MSNTESAFYRGLVLTAVQSPLDNRKTILSMQVEPYFWEEGGNPNVDWWAKVRHSLHFGGVKAVAGAEAIGEVKE